MELNEDQSTIFNVLTSHYLDKQFQIYLISGYAGTGKTTLITEFVKFLNENNKSVTFYRSHSFDENIKPITIKKPFWLIVIEKIIYP